MTKIDNSVFLELYNQGFSDTKIASILNIERHSIHKIRKQLDLPAMSFVQFYKDEITEMALSGYSDFKIAKKLNISVSMANYIRNKLNIPTNNIERTYSTKECRIKGYMIRNIKYSAKRRNLEFDLDYKDITLPKYCPILEVELDYKSKKFNEMFVPTIDRIDNSKGYIKGNIIVISRMANAMKSNANLDQLKLFSKNINKLINYLENQDARGSITDLFFNNEELSLDS